MNGMQIATKAREQISELTGLKADTVSAFGKTDAGYQVIVEMLELVRVPNSMDVLATYETQLDKQGNLVSYERTRRYHRNEMQDKLETRQ
jgi:hypothetical protein